jgi:flagellar motor component MotA
MRFSPIIGGLVSLSVVLLGCLLGAPLSIFFDVPVLIFAVTLPLAFLVQAHGVSGLRITAQAVDHWLDPADTPPPRLADACAVADTGSRATIHCAHIPMLIGAVQMLQSGMLNDVLVMGPAVAVALLTYLYAHCINFVFWGPLRSWLRQHAEAGAAVSPEPKPGPAV